MIKKVTSIILIPMILILILGGCKSGKDNSISDENISSNEETALENLDTIVITPTESELELEEGLSTVLYNGDYGFDAFLEQGGGRSDLEVVEFLSKNLLLGEGLMFKNNIFGCSTISVKSNEGQSLFGRNFDWQQCNALIIEVKPNNGYSSISTVNMDFITGVSSATNLIPKSVENIAALYAPLDGMNEKGLCVAVLMIQDSEKIEQNTGKSGITTTTAIRLMLDKAATVDEAIILLGQYDMNASMGMAVHFAISDANGHNVVVEYINNEMIIIESAIATNFYLADGAKNGIGTSQSHERYDILSGELDKNPKMSMEQLRDVMDSVSKDNFNEFESTEWSVLYNQNSGEVEYFHRENYDKSYIFNIFD